MPETENLRHYAKYREIRRENPLLAASTALQWAKTPDYAAQWEETSSGTYSRQVDGFGVTLSFEIESECPEQGSMLGEYVDWRYNADGSEHRPVEETPLGLPPKIFASGAYSQDRGAYPYFIPSNVEDFYDHRRKCGASRSVAWMDTYEMVSETIRDYFGAPLVNAYLRVTVELEGVELGSDSIGTDYIDNREGRDYVFQCVADHGMVETAIEEARATLAILKAAA